MIKEYGSTYSISVHAVQDIDILEDLEEREELEEIIDDEINEVQEQIEIWCKYYKSDYDFLENHRCIVTTHGIYEDEILPGTLKAIEDNLLNETYITFEVMEDCHE